MSGGSKTVDPNGKKIPHNHNSKEVWAKQHSTNVRGIDNVFDT